MKPITILSAISATTICLAVGVSPSLPQAAESRPDLSPVCSIDARLCPDGTFVSQSGPRCEFTPCPEARTAPLSTKDSDIAGGEIFFVRF